ncbi:DUF4299 family protein [Campylobacter sp. faydin G-105]|uniref:DUF4299 family protein n=1 Tax=Campylobacter anatolicus TaxID=2829105 RepID=UPI001B96CAB7|nr:DUF4299 family protein [Campylobacter anatolicus]MBR8461270.1 DUF4299 family protein [Campylobacter anatolicus]
MSVVFSVKNKKSLFGGYKSTMSVEEALQVAPNLTQFSFDESSSEFDAESFYNAMISDFDFLIVGVDGVSGRGFELDYDEITKTYNIRVATPSTRDDWYIALEYLSNLAKKLSSDIATDIDDKKYNSDSILKFDYEKDVMFGLEIMRENLSGDLQTNINYGVIRPLALNLVMVDEILASSDPIDAYSQKLTQVQYIDAYSARQRFFRANNSGEIIGLYTLTQGVDTILPYKPGVEYYNLDTLGGEEVSQWQLSFVCFDENAQDEESAYFALDPILDYNEVIENLPKDSYKFIDATYILVSGLSREVMEHLAEICEKK